VTTVLEPPPVLDVDASPLDETDVEQTEPTTTPAAPPASVGRITLAASLSTLGGGWMIAHLFHAVALATALGAVGVVIGATLTWAANRRPGRGWLAYLVLPAAALAGAVASSAAGGGGDLPSLLSQTLRAGGLQDPPIPFDAGWRFLVIALLAFVAAASVSLAAGLDRPKLAVGLPSLVTLPAALLQPKGHEVVTTGGAVLLVVAGLAVAYGADLADQVSAGLAFELRRLARAGVLIVGCLVALVLAAQTSFLFPKTTDNRVIPPRKPPASDPLPPDQVLFTVQSKGAGPWRIGVLNSYGDNAFLLPSVDHSRLKKLSGDIATSTHKTYTTIFTLEHLKGQTLPSPATLLTITGIKKKAAYDPETDLVSLTDDNVSSGLSYTVTAPVTPSGDDLRKAGAVDPKIATRFTKLTPVPPRAQALIDKAPTTNSFDRLQYLRSALLSTVVAAGAGGPVDIKPGDVDAMLAGGNATPYQIVAAQVMLARWAGIPAEVGFGFYGGTAGKDGTISYLPGDGSAWIEAYFNSYGWVPIIGTPQKAQPTLSKNHKNQAKTKPTDRLALSIYIPVRQVGLQLFYQVARYYALRVGAVVLPLVLLVIGYPFGLKLLRGFRRRRWGRRHGAIGRVLAAYGGLRDACYDLNIGDPRLTPLQFTATVEDDAEHAELAWLVTRAVWGDLRRDLREEDAQEAEELAASVLRRLRAKQTVGNRFVAAVSRTSLRDPWSDELPNAWVEIHRPHLPRLVRVRRGRLRFFRLATS